MREQFSYDTLNRLTKATLTKVNNSSTNLQSFAAQYDKLGNLCSKNTTTSSSKAANYTYSNKSGCAYTGTTNTSPHAVQKVVDGNTGVTYNYSYNQNGDMTSGDASGSNNDRTTSYNATRQMVQAKVTNSSGAELVNTSFSYGLSGRYKRTDKASGVTTTTYYVGSMEIIKKSNNTITETKRYLPAGILLITKSNTSTLTQRALLTDHLGSIDVVTDQNGAIQETMAFDPHGSRRDTSDWQGAPTTIPTSTTKGFTGQEHIDSANLIHYNGRVYDPYLGRFIQADPIVEAPTNAQSWNRYTYVFNNPLTLTDPTGYSSEGWRTIASIAISIASAGAASGVSAIIAKMAIIAAGGALSTAVATGSSKGMLLGAFTAVAFYGVGRGIDNFDVGSGMAGISKASMNLAAKTLAHGTLGGVMSKLQGGKFGDGFITAGVTHFASVKLNLNASSPNFKMENVVKAALIGGTVSRITGNKFGSGAVTAAFANAFGQVAQQRMAKEQNLSEAADLNDPDNWNFVKNRDWRDNISISKNGSHTDISIGLTVSADSTISEETFQGAMNDIASHWNGSYRLGDNTYSVNVSLTPVNGRSDLTIIPSVTGSNWGLVGGNQMALVLPNGFGAGTAAHEFGHNLGFGHTYNFTHQIMSYCFGCRSVTAPEVSRLTSEYSRK